MPQSIGFKLTTTSDETRDRILQGLIDMLDSAMRPGDETTLTLTRERPTARGSRKTTDKIEWQAGEPAPMLEDFGIASTQLELELLAQRLQSLGVDIRVTRDQDVSASPGAPSAQPVSAPQLDEQQLTDLERSIIEAAQWGETLDEQPPAAPSDTDETPSDDSDA